MFGRHHISRRGCRVEQNTSVARNNHFFPGACPSTAAEPAERRQLLRTWSHAGIIVSISAFIFMANAAWATRQKNERDYRNDYARRAPGLNHFLPLLHPKHRRSPKAGKRLSSKHVLAVSRRENRARLLRARIRASSKSASSQRRQRLLQTGGRFRGAHSVSIQSRPGSNDPGIRAKLGS